MANIQNNTESWNGHTGAEVEGYLKDRLSTIELNAKEYINSVQELESEGFTTYTFLTGTTKSYLIKVPTVLTSGFSVILNKFESDTQFVSRDGNINFNYAFTVKDANDNLVGGKSCQIKLTIKSQSGTNSKVLSLGTTAESRAASVRTGSFSVNGSLFFEGNNEVSVELVYVLNNLQSTMVEADGVERTLVISSFDLCITSSESLEFAIDKLVSRSNTGLFNIIHTMKSGKNLPDGINPTIKLYGYSSGNPEAGLLSINYQNGSDIDLTSFSDSNGHLTLFIQSEATIGTIIVKSNVIKYQYILDSAVNNNTYYAYKIDNYTALNEDGSINDNTVYTIANLYDVFTWNVYTLGKGVYNYTLNGNLITSVEYTDRAYRKLEFTQTLLKAGTNIFSISNGLPITLNVSTAAITNDLSVPTNPALDLSASGKLGNDSNWGGVTSFNNFDWSISGWDGLNLVVTNDARATINITPFSDLTYGKTISIRFKTSNIDLNEVLASCYDTFGKNGFLLTGLKAILYKGGSSCSTLFDTNNSYKEVTFVWHTQSYGNLGEIYINGERQALVLVDNNVTSTSNIIINAINTVAYISNITVYNRELTFSEIQALYCMHKNSNIGDYVTSNAIFSNNITLGSNGLKVIIDSLPVGSSYMLIKAHPYDLSSTPFWLCLNSVDGNTAGEGELKKGWKLLVGNTYFITKTEDPNVGHPENFFVDSITISDLGTSSMGYPLKNYRIYLNKKMKSGENFNLTYSADAYKWSKSNYMLIGDKVTNITTDYSTSGLASSILGFKIFENSLPVSRLCLKADYAESSGTHNTGFARLANKALEESKTIFTGESKGLPINSFNPEVPVRSTIDGRAIYLFFEDREGNQVYAGRYNMNNDKANEAVFGFTDNGLKNQRYFDNDIVQNEAQLLKGKFTITDDSFELTHFTFTDSNGVEHVNPTECWEFSTNEPSGLNVKAELKTHSILKRIGAFTFPYSIESGYPYSNNTTFTGFDPFTVTIKDVAGQSDGALAWLNTEQAWEYRYPELEGEQHKLYAEGKVLPYLLKTLYKWLHKHNVYCWNDSLKELYAAEFAANLHKYFNINYLLKYYMLTKMFVNADQRIKNCMLAFYCDPNAIDGPIGHMRAYYLFYDNDTILGLNNNGQLAYSWNADEIGVYPGVDDAGVGYHAIWGNLEYCYNKYVTKTTTKQTILDLGQKIDEAYKSLRNVLSDEVVLEFFDTKLPSSAENVDVEVKYLYPNELTSMNGVSQFNPNQLARFTGTRKAWREWFITNRLRWFDAKYGNDVKYSLQFKANDVSWISDNIRVVSAIDRWRFTADHKGTLLSRTDLLDVGKEGVLSLQKMATISDPSSIQGLYGAREIDFSNLYGSKIENNGVLKYPGMSTLELTNELPYLEVIRLGNLNYDFCAPLGSVSDVLRKTPNLKELYVTNVTAYKQDNIATSYSIDLSNLHKLSIVDFSKTDFSSVTLPKSDTLTKVSLYMPVELLFINNTNLLELVVEDTSRINNISATHCSEALYKSLIKLYNNLATKCPLQFVLGSGVIKDQISLDTLSLFVELASNKLNNNWDVNVSGTAYCPSGVTIEQLAKLNEAFPDLTIVTSSSDAFELTAQGTLLEGSSVDILASLPVDKSETGAYLWSIKATGDSLLVPLIEIENTSLYKCTIKVNPIDDNVSRDALVTIKAIHGGEEHQITISAQCKKINLISLTTTKLIVSQDGTSTIKVAFNSGHTKSHWVTNKLEVVATTGSVEKGVNTDGVESIVYKNSDGKDAIVTVSLMHENLSADILMYHNTIISKTDLDSDAYKWLHDIIDHKNPTTYSREVLSTYTISMDNGSIVCDSQTVSNPSEITTPQDLSCLEFFKTSTTITLPSAFPFINLRVPDSVTAVQWTSLATNLPGTIITMPLLLESAIISLSTPTVSQLTGLLFDLLKCAKITSITNCEGNNLFIIKTFLISVTSTSGALTDNAYDIEKPLFIYRPNTITKIGYYPELMYLTSTAFPLGHTMFTNNTAPKPSENISGTPLFYLGNITNTINGVYVGAISSYVASSPLFDLGASNYIKGLYYTFEFGSGLQSTTGLLTFSMLETLGDRAFAKINNEWQLLLQFGNALNYVGYAALLDFKGNVYTTNNSTALVLNNSKVGSSGLQGLRAMNFKFTGSIQLESQALANGSNSYNIDLNPNGSSMTISGNAFYDGTSTNIRHAVTLTSDNEILQNAIKVLEDTVTSLTIKNTSGDIVYQSN